MVISKRIIVWPALLAITLLTAAGCNMQASSKGLAQIALAKQQFEKRQFPLAIQTLSNFIAREPQTKQAPEALYLRGLCYRGIGPEKDQLAQQDFIKAAKKTGNPHITAMSQTALGHILFEKQPPDYQNAIGHYQNAIKKLPDNLPPKDAALYRLGASLQAIGKWTEADGYLAKCFNSFENSEFTAPAKQRFGARAFQLQVGAFANRQNALKTAAELSGLGWKAGSSIKKDGQELLYIVHTGKYNTIAKAQVALKQLHQTSPAAFITVARLAGAGVNQ